MHSIDRKRGLGPFTGGQLTVIIVAICAVFALPTAARAAAGAFTVNSSGTPAVKGTNTNANGIGVAGVGKRYGVWSNGPLGVATGKPLSCDECVTRQDIEHGSIDLGQLASNAILICRTSNTSSRSPEGLQRWEYADKAVGRASSRI